MVNCVLDVVEEARIRTFVDHNLWVSIEKFEYLEGIESLFFDLQGRCFWVGKIGNQGLNIFGPFVKFFFLYIVFFFKLDQEFGNFRLLFLKLIDLIFEVEPKCLADQIISLVSGEEGSESHLPINSGKR